MERDECAEDDFAIGLPTKKGIVIMKYVNVIECALIVALATAMGDTAAAQSAPKFHYLHGGAIQDVVFLDEDRGWLAEHRT
jgi:hypothetical protein